MPRSLHRRSPRSLIRWVLRVAGDGGIAIRLLAKHPARSSGPAVISEARAQSASCPATAALSLCQTASACTRSSAGCTSHRSSSCRCARWSALHRRACRRAWPGSVPQTVRRRALLDSRPSWGEKKIERRRLWPKRDTTAWTTVRRTRHIIGTCVRGNLWTVEKMPDRAPLGVSTICATPLIAAYLRLSRLSGNFSNRRAVRQRAGDTEDRELRVVGVRFCRGAFIDLSARY